MANRVCRLTWRSSRSWPERQVKRQVLDQSAAIDYPPNTEKPQKSVRSPAGGAQRISSNSVRQGWRRRPRSERGGQLRWFGKERKPITGSLVSVLRSGGPAYDRVLLVTPQLVGQADWFDEPPARCLDSQLPDEAQCR